MIPNVLKQVITALLSISNNRKKGNKLAVDVIG